jgi:hypothetical protein
VKLPYKKARFAPTPTRVPASEQNAINLFIIKASLTHKSEIIIQKSEIYRMVTSDPLFDGIPETAQQTYFPSPEKQMKKGPAEHFFKSTPLLRQKRTPTQTLYSITH